MTLENIAARAAQNAVETFVGQLQRAGASADSNAAALRRILQEQPTLAGDLSRLKGMAKELRGTTAAQPLQQAVFAVLFEPELQEQQTALQRKDHEALYGLLTKYVEAGDIFLADALLQAMLPAERRTLLLTPDNDGATALHKAIAKDQKAMAQLLLASVAPDERRALLMAHDYDGRIPLHWAVAFGKGELAQLLLEAALPQDQPALLRAEDNDCCTPLHWVDTYSQEDATAVEQLLAAVTTNEQLTELLQLKNKQGQTPLQQAVIKGNVKLTERLLQAAGPRCHELLMAQDDGGRTPLNTAVYHGHKQIAALLLQAAGADKVVELLATPGYNDRGPLHEAAASGQEDMMTLLLNAAGQRRHELLQSMTGTGPTPLHIAVGYNKLEIVKLLLSGTPEQNRSLLLAKDRAGATPLHYAIKKGDIKLIRLLLRDADSALLLARDGEGLTALHHACQGTGRPEVAALLLEAAGDAAGRLALLQARDARGMIPFHHAVGGTWLDKELLTATLGELAVSDRLYQLSSARLGALAPLTHFLLFYTDDSLDEVRATLRLDDEASANAILAYALQQSGWRDDAGLLLRPLLEALPLTAEDKDAPWHQRLEEERQKEAAGRPNSYWEYASDVLLLHQLLRAAPPGATAQAVPAPRLARSLINQICALVPAARRHQATIELLALFGSAGGVERYEKLYRELGVALHPEWKRQPIDQWPPDQQINRLTPYLALLLRRYDDATALQLAQTMAQCCSATALKDGRYSGSLLDLFIALDSIFLPPDDAVALLTGTLQHAPNALALSKQLTALRAVEALNGVEELLAHLRSAPLRRALARGEVAKRQSAYDALLQRAAQDPAYSAHSQKLEALKQRDALLKGQLVGAAPEELKALKAQRRTVQDSIKALGKPKEIRELERELRLAEGALRSARAVAERAGQPDVASLLKEMMVQRSNGLVQSEQVEKVMQFFKDSRYAEAPLLYMSNLMSLPSEARQWALDDLKLWIDHLDDLRALRCRLDGDPHLTKMAGLDAAVVQRWNALTADQELLAALNARAFAAIKGQETTPLLLLRRALVDDRHLPAEQCSLVVQYLEGGEAQRAAVHGALQQALTTGDERSRDAALAQQWLVDLLEAEGEAAVAKALRPLAEIATLLGLPPGAPFRGDLEQLQKMAAPAAAPADDELLLTLSDDPVDLLLVGTDIEGSCQSITRDPQYCRGLVGYLLNGRTLPLGHKDPQSGKWMTRVLLRLAYGRDEGGAERPLLLLERLYPSTIAPEQADELRGAAAFIADKLGIAAVRAADEGEAATLKGEVFLEKGRAAAEYVDAAATPGVIEGEGWPCRLCDCCLLTV